MKRLKIISKLTDFWRVRPVFVIVVAVLAIDGIYVNLSLGRFGTSNAAGNRQNIVNIQGRVTNKAYDENDELKSVTVGNTLCYVNNTDAFDTTPVIGETVKFSGKIKTIDSPMNPGEFNKKTYYGSKGIFYEMTIYEAKSLKKPVIGLKETFFKIRRNFSKRIMESFLLEGGTVNTLICADKTYLSKERKNLYTRVGVGHFLVISGLHISAVGTLIYRSLRRLGLKVKTGCVFTVSFLVLYGFFVGFSVSVIRAVIMFLIRLLADVLKRVYDMPNAVAIAALFNIIINPFCIIDSAFIYSYATVLSISVYIMHRPKRSTKPRSIRSYISETLKFPAFLWLFILPVNLYLSYSCSLMAIVANTFLAPMSVPILIFTFFGFLLSFTGFTFPVALMDFFIAVMLRSFDVLCKLVDDMPVFTFSGKISLTKLCIYYIVLSWIMFEGKKHTGMILRLGLLLGLILFAATPKNLSGRVTALYVGQGECVVIHTGARSAVIYDCGSTSKTGVGEYILIPYLKATGVGRIEGIFVSHGDTDHAGEVSYLCEKMPKEGIRLQHLYVQDIPKASKSKCLIEAETSATKNNIPVTFLSRGQKIKQGEYSFTCLWPKRGEVALDANAGSMVILASIKDFDTLLMGDATKETERLITESAGKVASGRIELLMVSHHGSDSASDPSFLEHVSPVTAVVSAGIDNRYGHPHKEVLERFKNICPKTGLFRTDKSGAVSVEPGAKKVEVLLFLR